MTRSIQWPLPEGSEEIEPQRGPVMVSIHYRIQQEQLLEIRTLLKRLRNIRKRSGA